jgi:hypothetical protein
VIKHLYNAEGAAIVNNADWIVGGFLQKRRIASRKLGRSHMDSNGEKLRFVLPNAADGRNQIIEIGRGRALSAISHQQSALYSARFISSFHEAKLLCKTQRSHR